MRLRVIQAAAFATLAALAPAAPALAHEEISPDTVTVGQPAYLTLTVANEKDAKLVKIQLDAPRGVEFGTALEGKDGWVTTRSSGRMVWDGTVNPEHFESFRYEIEGPDQPGTLTYKVTLSFAGGLSEEHEVGITAAAPGPGGAGTASATSVTTASSAPPTTAAAAPADSGSGSDGGSGTAKAALAVSIVALLVAAGALAVGARNRSSGGGAAAGAAQDW